jgi:ribonuclease HI
MNSYIYEVYVLGRATNNIAEYSAVVELLVDAISLRIRCLVVRLDSQLIVLQLSNVYSIRSPTSIKDIFANSPLGKTF